MKQMSVILLFLSCIGLFAQADSLPEKKGFFSFGYIMEFQPFDKFQYNNQSFEFQYGSVLPEKSSVMAGLHIRGDGILAMVGKYEYNIFKINEQFISGVEVSLLFGTTSSGVLVTESTDALKPASEEDAIILDNTYSYSSFLAVGIKFGLFLKMIISQNKAILFRTGVTNKLIPIKDFELSQKNSHVYFGIEGKWYFH